MSNILNLTESTFDNLVIESKRLIVVDFWAPWCGPCKQLTPILESVLKDVSELFLGKVNVDDEASLAKKYQIKGLPTLLLFKEGELQATHVGLAPKEKIVAFVRQKNS